MGAFDKDSNFNREANFLGVKFGEGKPVLEVELNEMQEVQTEARADIIRETMPSGFTSISDLDYVYMSANPNSIKLVSDSVAFVNGYKITIPAGTIIQLNAPPEKDSREDLVFLEVWKEAVTKDSVLTKFGGEGQSIITNQIKDERYPLETTQRYALRWRIRVANNIDFNAYPEGFPVKYSTGYTNKDTNPNFALPQGGNTSPLDLSILGYVLHFSSASDSDTVKNKSIAYDTGLYVSGRQKDRTMAQVLKTVDGFVYAIPMFKIKRRNTAGFSKAYEYAHIGASDIKSFGNIVNQDRVTHTQERNNSISIKGRTLKNEISNGDFSKGFTGWAGSVGTIIISTSNNECVFKVTMQNGRAYYVYKFLENRKYYIQAKIKSTSNLVGLDIDGALVYHSGSGKYETLSMIVPSLTVTNKGISARDYRTSNWDEIYQKDFLLIDLTDIFGSGKEPTKEWCDQNITYFDGIKSVGEQEGNKVLINNVGKNLIDSKKDFDRINNVTVTKTEKGFILEGTQTQIYPYGGYLIKVKPNTKYTLQREFRILSGGVSSTGRVAITDKEVRDTIAYASSNVKNVTFTSPSDGYVYVLFYGKQAETTVGVKVEFYNIQLEESETATQCELYKSNKIIIPVKEPLRSLPNEVKDEIIKEGKVIRKTGKVVLNGSELWGPNATLTNETYLVSQYQLNTVKDKGASINDKFNNNINFGKEETLSIGYQNYVYISILKSRLSTPDIAGLKAWLQANPVTVYYELANQVEESTDSLWLYFNTGINNIFSENLIPPNISLKVGSKEVSGEYLNLTLDNTDVPYKKNIDGARDFFVINQILDPVLSIGMTRQITVTSDEYNKCLVGDIFGLGNTYKIISKDGSNKITILANGTSNVGNLGGYPLLTLYRPDMSCNNIVNNKDIIDLRHQVSLSGFNYKRLLEENLDRVLTNDLQSKERTKLLRTYHGVPKTPIDNNTIFYASLDGTSIAEKGGALTLGSGSFQNMPTGLGYKFNGGVKPLIAVNDLSSDTGTIDVMVETASMLNDVNHSKLIQLSTADKTQVIILGYYSSGGYLTATEMYSDGSYIQMIYEKDKLTSPYTHIRITWDNTIMRLFINGVQVKTYARKDSSLRIKPTHITIGGAPATHGCYELISDVSISNIDRGNYFPTLPKDFIEGKARISSAFNKQRSAYSDAIISERVNTGGISYPTKLAEGYYNYEAFVNRGVYLGSDTSYKTSWVPGDKITIKAMTENALISGVIDEDTALARVIEATPSGNNYIVVDNASKISVGDDILLVFLLLNLTESFKVTGVDTKTNVVTLDKNTFYDKNENWIVVETTALTSSPKVLTSLIGSVVSADGTSVTLGESFSSTNDSYKNLTILITEGKGVGQSRVISAYTGSTRKATVTAWDIIPDTTSKFRILDVPVLGTWSGLGSKEAIFTLGNGLFSDQDIFIDYSLNEYMGQGAVPETLNSVLLGECKGTKLIPSTVVKVRDDFTGKISGSLVENSHIAKVGANTALQNPLNINMGEFSESLSENKYSQIIKLDGNNAIASTTLNTYIPQHLFAFNLMDIVEKKFGKIKAVNKIQWLRDNIAKLTCNWWGYGKCPSGNKVMFTAWLNTSWNQSGVKQSTSSVVTNISYITTSGGSYINDNGYVYFLAYTDPSNGTISSIIYTDYLELEVELKTPSGYDILSPENINSREDKGNVLLIKKENREIRTLFEALNSDMITTYGEYTPSQGNLISADITILEELGSFVISDLSTATAHMTSNKRAKYLSTIINQNNVFYKGSFGIAELPLSADTRGINIGKKLKLSGGKLSDNYEVQSSVICREGSFIAMTAYLVLHEGSLKLLLYSTNAGVNKYVEVNDKGICMLIDLANKNLVKLADGRVFPKLLETSMRNGVLTNTSVVYNTITNTNIIRAVTWGDLG